MTALDQIRELLDQPGRDLNDAARYYAEHNTDVPHAIKAEPVLYGELARGALRWTADLLTAIELSAATRPASAAAAGLLADRVAAYFEGSSRWPPVAHMQHPLRLLMPAYYAVCGVQLLGYHVQPPLLHVEHDEPDAFIEEVLGRGPSMTIRQHKNADLSSMPKVVEDATAYEPLAFRSFLSARQRARLAEARAAAPRVPADSAPAQPPPVSVESGASTAQDEADSILAALWARRLRDTRITLRAENSYDTGYSGDSSYFSVETFLDLLDGGKYRLLETIDSRISGSGLTIGGEPRTTESWGEWSVHVSGGSEQLRLDEDGGEVTLYRIADGGNGSVEVDGEDRRWTRL